MRAIDTNILVRYITRDHPEQAERARRILHSEPLYLSATVVLETAWVLESSYHYPRDLIAAALRRVLGYPTLRLPPGVLIGQALSWYEYGMDVADAIHSVVAEGCSEMVSFDKPFATAARRLGAMPVTAPPKL